MKKIFTILVAVFCLSFTAQAQLADGSVAPDFTLTDINGNTHTLSEYLAEGKTVILDVSATWCGPCWGMHQNHVLKTAHEDYGVDGRDDVVVIWVEGDDATTAADLNGTGTNTQGDWVTDTPYAIVESSSLNTPYAIAGFPTIYTICPEGTTTLSPNYGGTQLYELKANTNICYDPVGSNNASLLQYAGFEGEVCGGLSFAPQAVIQNVGSEAITSALVEVTVDGAVVSTTEWTGSLASQAVEILTLEDVMVTGENAIEATITAVNAGADDDTSENSASSATTAAASYTTADIVTVTVVTDEYADETFWAFVDNQGNMLASGGNPNVGLENYGTGTYPAPVHEDQYAPTSTYTIEVSLPQGVDCYEFIVTDYFGDGVCCTYGDGSVTATTSEGEVIGSASSFGAISTTPAELDVMSVNTTDVIVANNVALFPNPVQNELNVSFDLATTTALNLSIKNAIGQTMTTLNTKTYNAGANTLAINTSDLANGVYIVSMQSAEGTNAFKFTVNK